MLRDKKWKLSWILFTISLVLNVMIVYFLFDNAITISYAEMDRQRYIRQKTDAIDFLNIALQDNTSFDIAKAKTHFLNKKERLYRPDDDGEFVLGELCFQKVRKNYKVSFCNE